MVNKFIYIYNSQEIKDDESMEITFSHYFEDEMEVVEFAFCQPWSYNDNLLLLGDIMDKCNRDVYINRSLLIQTVEGRRIDLIVISSHKNITDKKEK